VLGLLRHFNTHISRRQTEQQVKKKTKLKEAMMVKSSRVFECCTVHANEDEL
jgi:hypothetical protein